MAKQIDFWTLLKLTQEYVSQHYAAVLTDKNKLGQLKAYVDKYLRDNDYHVENLTTKELIDKLYCEMAEYSVASIKTIGAFLLPKSKQKAHSYQKPLDIFPHSCYSSFEIKSTRR